MSSFYTNIQLAGDTILYRGYEDGKPFSYRANFAPTLYVLSRKHEDFERWMANTSHLSSFKLLVKHETLSSSMMV